MRKIEFTVVLIALVFASLLFTACQKAKEPGTKKEATVQKAEIKPVVEPESKEAQQSGVSAMSEKTADIKFERPKRCEEIMKKYKESELNEEDGVYLWNACKIPAPLLHHDRLTVITWWKDEYGYEEYIYDQLNDIIKLERYKLKPEYVEAIKNIALNSKYSSVQERAILVLNGISDRKAKPIIKEVLRKEVDERGATNDSRKSVIYWAGRLLTENSEYEYAFPYLMKAKVFNEAVSRNDMRVIPFLKDTLNDSNDFIRIDAALALINFNEDKEKVLFVLIDFIKRTNNKALDYKSGIPAYRSFAFRGLGQLNDKRAIDILEEALRNEDNLGAKDIKDALDKIRGRK